jgi:hypothetical protein
VDAHVNFLVSRKDKMMGRNKRSAGGGKEMKSPDSYKKSTAPIPKQLAGGITIGSGFGNLSHCADVETRSYICWTGDWTCRYRVAQSACRGNDIPVTPSGATDVDQTFLSPAPGVSGAFLPRYGAFVKAKFVNTFYHKNFANERWLVPTLGFKF